MIVRGTDGVDANASVGECESGEQTRFRVSNGVNGCNRPRIGADCFEIIGRGFFRYGDDKRVECLAMFEEAVDVLVNIWSERIRHDAPESERAMAEFASTLKPSGDAALGQNFAGTVEK